MGRPGRKRRLALEDEYWKLIGDGVGTVEACRRLGIGRTTGYYWRAHRGGLLRTTLPEDTRSGRYLSLLERERIGVSAATRNCPETATKLPAGGHENCPLTVTGSARHDVVCLAALRG